MKHHARKYGKRSGDAMPRSGDLVGQIGPVATGSGKRVLAIVHRAYHCIDISACACSNQKRMSISRYMEVAMAKCSRA